MNGQNSADGTGGIGGTQTRGNSGTSYTEIVLDMFMVAEAVATLEEQVEGLIHVEKEAEVAMIVQVLEHSKQGIMTPDNSSTR